MKERVVDDGDEVCFELIGNFIFDVFFEIVMVDLVVGVVEGVDLVGIFVGEDVD